MRPKDTITGRVQAIGNDLYPETGMQRKGSPLNTLSRLNLPIAATFSLLLVGCPLPPISSPSQPGAQPINIVNNNEAKADANSKTDSTTPQPGVIDIGYQPSGTPHTSDPTTKVTPDPKPKNTNPTVASVTASPTSITTAGTVTITATATDAEGDTLTYAWSAEGGTITGAGATATYTAPNTAGTNKVTVTVTDAKGGSTTSSVAITVTEPTPVPNSWAVKSADWRQ
jgi:hypothetical protein